MKDFFSKPMMRVVLGRTGPRNRILGMELSGDIVEKGKDVTRFQVGDSVFASTEFQCGAYAEYCCIPEDGILAAKPATMTHEEAAPVSNARITALIPLCKARIRTGDTVLIYSARRWAVVVSRRWKGVPRNLGSIQFKRV